MTDNFTEDSKIQQIAEAYAADAVDFAHDHFKIKLDWTDGSVAHIETMLGVFHDQIKQAKPSEDQILGFSKMFGSYIGETFRHNHGATWGLVNLGGQTFPGLNANGSAGLFWPWGRAQNRIVNGPEDNAWHYYQTLLHRNGGTPTQPAPAPPQSEPHAPSPQSTPNPTSQKKSWWDRIRGA